MKKKLIVTVLLSGFAGVTHAKNSVTLYGILDGGLAYQSVKVTQGDNYIKTSNFGMAKFNGVRNGNRWGLRGSEDLGNGSKVIFNLESGFDLSNGKSLQGGRLFGRQSYFGVSNDNWGVLTLGRQSSIAGTTITPRGPFHVGYKQAGHLAGAFGASVFARMDNAIKYWTPTVSGLRVGVAYSGNVSKTESDVGGVHTEKKDASNWLSAGANYGRGPVGVGLSYDRFRKNTIDSKGVKHKGTVSMWNLFGHYDFESFKLDLGYGQVRGAIGNPNSATVEMGATPPIGLNAEFTPLTKGMRGDGLMYHQTNGYRQQAWTVGLTVPVGEFGKLLASYQGALTKNGDRGFDGVKSNLSIFSLGYEYSLSKRSLIYSVASYATGRLKFDNNSVNPKAKLKSTVLGVGLLHRF
ncbi:MAG: porin [Alcaligenaceae bacterium]|nr:porin [Alcaligenaceae bacterium]